MISYRLAYAIFLRYVYRWFRDFDTAVVIISWPLRDILIWSFLDSWIEKAGSLEHYEEIAFLGILLWQVIGRGYNIIGWLCSEDLFSYNVLNLFSLPLKMSEWIAGTILFYMVEVAITSVIGIAIIGIIYTMPIYEMVYTYLIFFPPLLLSGIWLGFTCLQIIVMFGKSGRELGFMIGGVVLPFSGAYYPIEILPVWAQKISVFLPMSYVFQAMRNYFMKHEDPTLLLIKGYLLASVYATVSVALFVYCFAKVRERGLVQMLD